MARIISITLTHAKREVKRRRRRDHASSITPA